MQDVIDAKFRVVKHQRVKRSASWQPRLEIDVDPTKSRFAWTEFGRDIFLAVVGFVLAIVIVNHFVPLLAAVLIVLGCACGLAAALLMRLLWHMYQDDKESAGVRAWNRKFRTDRGGGAR